MSPHTHPRPSIARRPSAAVLRDAHGGGNRRTVIVAFSGNVVIAAAKLVAALITGSSAMLAETLHSTADCVNQLMLGLSLRGRHRPPDADHPFGYQAAGFLWAFLATLARIRRLLFAGLFGLLEPNSRWTSFCGVRFAESGTRFGTRLPQREVHAG